MSYGTVMIARLRPGSPDDALEAGRRWVAERAPVVRGFEDEWVMVGDDGTLVLAVRFASKEDYVALADDPAQDTWWQEHMAPILEDVRWVDGTWEAPIRASGGA
jgi:hypothetical protein